MQFHDLHPPPENLFLEVQKGLLHQPKKISPKFFYDQKGSSLFEKITALPEYYLTKTEIAILKSKGREIGRRLGDGLLVVEYGCGSSEKIHWLLDCLHRPRGYVAVEIAKDPLLELSRSLSRDYPHLEIIAVCADFTKPLALPLNGNHRGIPRLAFFPGSSIGNFEPLGAVDFLSRLRREMGPGGRLLIGLDLKKDPKTLQQAYNDPAGVTEAFNKNLLVRLNRECGTDFKPDQFAHRAFYNKQEGRIEMHLESLSAQTVHLGERKISFAKGETIHTENSYKYHVEEFQTMAREAGWEPGEVWTDPERLFSLQYFHSSLNGEMETSII